MRALRCVGVFLSVFLAVVACERAGGERRYAAKKDDPRLVEAKKEAQRRWSEFVALYKKRGPTTTCSVKVPLPIRSGGEEHIWVDVKGIDRDTVRGTLANEPFEDIGYKLGDAVVVRIADIEDWVCMSGKSDMVGGFSIKALREIDKESGGP